MGGLSMKDVRIAADGIPVDAVHVLCLYALGLFPMGKSAAAERVEWFAPRRRAVFPRCRLRCSRSLRRAIRRNRFRITVDSDFEAVVDGCASRPETWINPPLRRAYRSLRSLGFAHSVEAWQNGELAGGVYGLAVGRAFFSESMFSRATDASKVALAHLATLLGASGFSVMDAQVMSPHLASLGAVDIPQDRFVQELAVAAGGAARFDATSVPSVHEVLHWCTQMS